MAANPSILVVDNYDSFVYNLVQYLGELGATVRVLRNDKVDEHDLASTRYDGVLVSPGPGHPRDAGNCVRIIRYCAENALPMLGSVSDTRPSPRRTALRWSPRPNWCTEGRPWSPRGPRRLRRCSIALIVGRYHSLVVDEDSLPDVFEVTARTGTRHGYAPPRTGARGRAVHPESVLTQDGYLLLANWLTACGSSDALLHAGELNAAIDAVRARYPRLVRKVAPDAVTGLFDVAVHQFTL